MYGRYNTLLLLLTCRGRHTVYLVVVLVVTVVVVAVAIVVVDLVVVIVAEVESSRAQGLEGRMQTTNWTHAGLNQTGRGPRLWFVGGFAYPVIQV